jgi:hypothetical protein
MAEVQTTTESGEMTQRFIEFVMMQAQNAALFLGQIPNPQSGKAEVNLDVAKMFIDQLAMVRVKTRGNLSSDEQAVLNNAISNLQMAFFEASQGKAAAPETPAPSAEPEIPAESTPAPQSPEPAVQPAPSEGESKKKFTKSYGA